MSLQENSKTQLVHMYWFPHPSGGALEGAANGAMSKGQIMQIGQQFQQRWVLIGTVLGACACGNAFEDDTRSAPAAAPTTPAPKLVEETPKAQESAEDLAVHMRDHLGMLTQARDALIRGRLTDAAGALTWLAQHREPTGLAHAQPFLDRLQQHARRGVDSADLTSGADAIGAIATTCGECHEVFKGGPKLEPSGFEDLNASLTVETHMHGYLWATETLWNALVVDPALWTTGVDALATLTPPTKPADLVAGFAAIRAWSQTAKEATTFVQRGQAYGRLVATCGSCHQTHGVDPAAAQ
jgi:cytochrome c553